MKTCFLTSLIIFILVTLFSLFMTTDMQANNVPAFELTSEPCEQRFPVDVILVVDRSSSMSVSDLDDAKAAIIQFVHLMDLAQDQVGLVTFNQYATLAVPLTQDAGQVISATEAITPSGGTNIAKAIEVGHHELNTSTHLPENSPVLILLSDGGSNRSTTVAAANAAKADGIRIISIGLGNSNNDLLKEIASSSRDYYQTPDSEDLNEIYEAINVQISCEPPLIVQAYLPVVFNELSCPAAQGVDVLLLIDRSSHMEGQPFIDAKTAVSIFIDQMDMRVDQVGLLSFASQATLEQPLTQDHHALHAALQSLFVGGRTNIAAAVEMAHLELQSPRHLPENRQVMILLSDGQQSLPGDPQLEARQAKEDGIHLITIAFGHPGHLDMATLQLMASSSQDFYHAPNAADLISIYREIATNIACQPSP